MAGTDPERHPGDREFHLQSKAGFTIIGIRQE